MRAKTTVRASLAVPERITIRRLPGWTLGLSRLRVREGATMWHEVSVLPAEGQTFEYLNYHPETGLLPYFQSRNF
jgi:hypothetical protein